MVIQFVSAEQDVIDMVLTRPIPVAGDVKVEFFHQPNRFRKVSAAGDFDFYKWRREISFIS